MNNEKDYVLIKSKDLEALKEPYYVAKKEFDLALKEVNSKNDIDQKKLRDQIYELQIKIQNNPPELHPMKLSIVIEDYNRDRPYYDRSTPYNYIEPINFELDQPISRQISNIVSIVTKSLFAKSEEIKKINIKELTEKTENKCYTEVANMEYFERRNFLKKFKIKK